MNMKKQMDRDQAELLAISGLQFIAGDHEQLARFLALSGVAPSDLRDSAGSADFLSGVLDFFLGNEATLLAFTASAGCDPSEVMTARNLLSRSQHE
ncbi:MAG: DUF3572 domain-containing protein [Nitratireductor sp.]|nr:DUF3572 domain-containing protein [Nitratireductor sp.]